MKTREIQLKTRPKGLPTAENFDLVETELPALGKGDVRVENNWMSVDPYMRGRMDAGDSYVPAFEVGETMTGGAIGTVSESQHPDFPVGTLVESMLGWREHFVTNCDAPGPNFDGGLQRKDPQLLPPQTYLGVAGMPGLTAYAGLLSVAKLQHEETVFVSAAAGAVGAVACQIAKLRGCRVIGSAGSDEKTTWLVEQAGVDVCINYKETTDLHAALGVACPEGIDVYFENVGGEHLDAALELMNQAGRIVVCGLISQYNATGPVSGPESFFKVLEKSLRVQGFIVTEFFDQYPAFLENMTAWIREDKIKWQETIFEGIAKAPEALMGLFHGANNGKMLVKLA